MVQRYDVWCIEDIFKNSHDGSYVKYEDYAKLEAELQKYKDQFPDYVECANCGSITHVEGVEDAMGQSGRREEDAQECKHEWVMHDVDDFQTCSKCGSMA